MKNLKYMILAALIGFSPRVFAFELFPESADKNAFFLNIKAVGISFTEGFLLTEQEFGFDYVLPIFMPLSLGVYFRIPTPNLKSFGIRLGYHINIQSEKTDLYALYVFDFGFLRNDLLRQYNDAEQEIHYYDFRAGVRQVFGKYFCLMLETGFKLQGFSIGIAVKIN